VRAPKVEIFKGYTTTVQIWDETPLWYWRLRAANGRIIADGSEGYASKSNAKRAVRRTLRLLYHCQVFMIVEVGK
jgi:hypothetical protein